MKEIVIKARLDTQDSVSQVEKLKKSIADVAKEDPSKGLELLNQRVDSGKMSIGELKKAIKDYQTIAIEAGQTSAIGQEALSRAGALKDKLMDIRSQMNVMATDGKAMNAAMTLSSTVVNGYSAFIGITQLAGGENKKLLETMAKMQIIMQTLNGIEQVATQLRKGSVLTTYAMNVAYKTLGISITGATAATRAFTTALISTGIGAIVVGIGMLIANLKELTHWIKKVTLGFEDNSEAIKKNSEALIENTQLATKGLEREYKRRLMILRAQGKETYETERELLLKKEQLIRRELALYIVQTKTLLALGKLSTEEARERLKKLREMSEEHKDIVAELTAKQIEYQRTHAKTTGEIFKRQDLFTEKASAITSTIVSSSENIAQVDEAISVSMNNRLKENEEQIDEYRKKYDEFVQYHLKLRDLLPETAASTLRSFGSIFEGLANMQKKGSEQYKRLALAGITASQAESIANAVVAASKASRDLGYDPTGLGRIAIYVSTFASITASAIASINKAKQILGTSGGDSAGSYIGASTSGGGVGVMQKQETTQGYVNPAIQQKGQIQKVVVLESDITRAQQSVNYMNKISAI